MIAHEILPCCYFIAMTLCNNGLSHADVRWPWRNIGTKGPLGTSPAIKYVCLVWFGDTADVRQLPRRSPSRRGQVVDASDNWRGPVGGHRLTVVRPVNRR